MGGATELVLLAVETASLKRDQEMSSLSLVMTGQDHLLPSRLVEAVCGHQKEEKRRREERREKLGAVYSSEWEEEGQGKWALPADHPLLEMRLELEGVVMWGVQGVETRANWGGIHLNCGPQQLWTLPPLPPHLQQHLQKDHRSYSPKVAKTQTRHGLDYVASPPSLCE